MRLGNAYNIRPAANILPRKVELVTLLVSAMVFTALCVVALCTGYEKGQKEMRYYSCVDAHAGPKPKRSEYDDIKETRKQLAWSEKEEQAEEFCKSME